MTTVDADGDAHVMVSVASGRPYDEGVNGLRYRLALVQPDGEVKAWDAIAGYYTWHHDMTPAEMDQARKLAGLKS